MDTIELLKLIASFLTPVTILLIGIFINKRLEKNKIEFLKQKEWQISWAKLLFETAQELNENISMLINSLYELQRVDGKKYLEKQILVDFNHFYHRIQFLEWNIRNYTQFASAYGPEVIQKQNLLLNQLQIIIKDKKGDLEVVRKTQFEYNIALRKAHAEILNLKSEV